MDTFAYVKALALQIVYKMLQKYPIDEILNPMPDTFIPRIEGSFIYKIGTDPIKTYISHLIDTAEKTDTLKFEDEWFVEVFSETIDSFIPEIRERIENATYNSPPTLTEYFDSEITKALIKQLPEKERRKHQTIRTFITFLITLDEEKKEYKHLSEIIRNRVKFYAVKSLPKKTKGKDVAEQIQNDLFNQPKTLTEKELLQKIGSMLNNTNALRNKTFNLYMLKHQKPIYTQNSFFSDETNRIVDIAMQLPKRTKLVYSLWKKAFVKQMIPFLIRWKDELDGKPPYPNYPKIYKKRKEDRFYVNVHELTHTLSKLKNTFPFTEREKWEKTYNEAKRQYYQILRDYSEFVHVAYILSHITPKWNYVPKMPGWLVNLSTFWKDVTRYEKRTQYVPIAKKQIYEIPKPVETKKEKTTKSKEELTLFDFIA